MTTIIRRQLTLFVELIDAEIIEEIRRNYNPIQFRLIKAHVTLCREDEIENLDQVIANLRSLKNEEIVVEFGKATRFENGKGLLLPGKKDNAGFHELRKKVLRGLSDHLKKQEPHITLMHPRNSTCTDEIFKRIEKVRMPKKLIFQRISLIEQERGKPWTILQEFELNERT